MAVATVKATYTVSCPSCPWWPVYKVSKDGRSNVHYDTAEEAWMVVHKHNHHAHGYADVMTNADGSAGDDGLSY